jgi:hypothetical protein
VPGFPIRTSTDPRLVGSSPWLIAASHVLLRLQAPRHPPLTLYNLENIDARARYGILKGRTTRAPVRNHLNTDRWKGAERAGERPADPQEGRRRRVGGTGIAPGCSSSRYRRSLPQNGIVMPTVIPRAHRPHERDLRRDAVRQGRDGDDSE